MEDLLLAERLIYQSEGLELTDIKKEQESSSYCAMTFKLGDKTVKFREGKITPTKPGHFVSLWKRDKYGTIIPHEESDPFNFYIISVRKGDKVGQFIFPSDVLVKNKILASDGVRGKNGFRVYPIWDIQLNTQAQKAQKWQLECFFELSDRKSQPHSLFIGMAHIFSPKGTTV